MASGSSRFEGRPTVCMVDLTALRSNFQRIREKVGPRIKILSMVKANAYGHGAPAVARTLAGEGSDAFGVATLEEGIELRDAGIREPIVVVAGVYPEQVDRLLAHGLIPAVYDVDTLMLLEADAQKRGTTLNIHLKVDTGMGRLGLLPAEIDSWLPALPQLRAIKIAGVFSHFSDAENVEAEYTQRQLKTFQHVLKRLKEEGISPLVCHIANSAATITLPSAYFNMVRPGLILYGVYPSRGMTTQIDLQPVLTWKTRILQLKKVPAGTSISYGQTFSTRRDSVIATLPVGYADGYPRVLSNIGEVLIGGRRAPIAGRVCMDLTMVDVTDIPRVQPSDEVVLLGRQGETEISAEELAAWSQTISYEVFTSISSRVPRIHV